MNLNGREFDPAEGLVNGSWHCYWIMVGSRSGSLCLVWYGRTTAPRKERRFLYTRIKFLHTKRVFVFLCVVWLHVERSSVYLAELLTLNPVNDELRPQPFVMQSERPSDQASQKSYTPRGYTSWYSTVRYSGVPQSRPHCGSKKLGLAALPNSRQKMGGLSKDPGRSLHPNTREHLQNMARKWFLDLANT